MLKIALIGAAGKMGKAILQSALDDDEVKIVECIEKKNHPSINESVFQWHQLPLKNLYFKENLTLPTEANIIVDFSSPNSTLYYANLAKENNIPFLSGTTGLSDSQLKELESLGNYIPVLYSPNMSIGVNLMFYLVKIIKEKLPQNYDFELIETHHRFKKDSPSGTAKKIISIINPQKTTFGREGFTGQKDLNELGVHSIRLGGVVGEHTLRCASEDEEIGIYHRAYKREVFAKGAILACKWLINQKPAFYSMLDVLDIKF